MGNLRKIVGISLAVAVAFGLVAFFLVPHAGPSNESVVVNQPQAPTTGDTGGGSGTGTSGSSGSGSGGSGSGSGGSSGGNTPSTPPSSHVRPPKLHGKNSEGPKHVVCLAENSHVQGVAQYQGANWYRGTCAQTAGSNSQGHANGHAYGPANAPANGQANGLTDTPGNGHSNGHAQGPSLVAQQVRSDRAQGH